MPGEPSARAFCLPPALATGGWWFSTAAGRLPEGIRCVSYDTLLFDAARATAGAPRMDEWRLSIGSRFTGVIVCADDQWPGMWRVHAPDGRVSDMVNLVRAKDAAISWGRPKGVGGSKDVRWHRRQTPSEGAYSEKSVPALPENAACAP